MWYRARKVEENKTKVLLGKALPPKHERHRVRHFITPGCLALLGLGGVGVARQAEERCGLQNFLVSLAFSHCGSQKNLPASGLDPTKARTGSIW